MSDLVDFFGRVIAKRDGIAPEEVTPQYIEEQREKRIYPNLLYDSPREGLRSLTQNQFKRRGEIIDEVLGAI